eukprot:XP_011673471.1 PREDICTED: uncharacterized protein LOC105442742 [Strongylocentrotus purpuratus]
MANRTKSIPSDYELLSLAGEITQKKDFFKLGVNLNFLIPVLRKSLKECSGDVYSATLMTLQQWRDNQRPGTDVRSKLHTILKELGHKAADMLVTDDADFDKRSLLRTVEVCTPSESSASITKNMDFQSDVTDEDSMVTSAMSHSDYSMSVKKDSKFDESGSGSEKPSESRSTGLTHGLRQLSVKPTSDPGRVTGWLNEAEAVRQPMIGAPGADRLPVKSIDDMETLKLKIYQEELAEPALQGHNTCVVAPTGSGKTYVAVAVPLVHQQSTVFKKYIKDVAYICGDHGQPEITRLPMDEVLKENDVVVLTAQILVDALTKGQVSFNQIGLIVLDECHETKSLRILDLRRLRYDGVRPDPRQELAPDESYGEPGGS